MPMRGLISLCLYGMMVLFPFWQSIRYSLHLTATASGLCFLLERSEIESDGGRGRVDRIKGLRRRRGCFELLGLALCWRGGLFAGSEATLCLVGSGLSALAQRDLPV